MKVMKRVVSLVLVLMMLFAMGIMGATATTEDQVIYFEEPTDLGIASWESTKVFCHIWEYGGESFAQWQAKKEACVKTETEGLWAYEITAKGFEVEKGKTYGVIFSNEDGMQTYDTIFDVTCIGDTLYCKGEDSIIEAPSDSTKTALATYWKNADPAKYGPIRQLTSIGNVVGECYAPGADAESLYVDFIENKLETTLGYVDMSQEELLAHASSQLGIAPDRAYELELEAGLHTPWSRDEAPTDSVTEPVEDTTTVPVEDTTTEPAEDFTTTPADDDAEETTTAPAEDATVPDDNTEETTTPDEATTDEVETNRYYFYKPGPWIDSKYSDTVGIYWWDGTDACTSWPGYEAEKADIEGVYYYDVPKDVTTIIWNNFLDGGMDDQAEIYHYAYQTNNIPCEYYDPEECVLYPEGNESFDGMIFVCNTMIYVSDLSAKTTYNGTWYYYYGNGEYGITPEKGDKFYTGSYQVDEPTTNDYEDIGYILGDVNGDRKLNIRDATLIQKFLAKLTVYSNEQVFLADFNEDDTVNIKDATTIQKKLANLL